MGACLTVDGQHMKVKPIILCSEAGGGSAAGPRKALLANEQTESLIPVVTAIACKTTSHGWKKQSKVSDTPLISSIAAGALGETTGEGQQRRVAGALVICVNMGCRCFACHAHLDGGAEVSAHGVPWVPAAAR